MTTSAEIAPGVQWLTPPMTSNPPCVEWTSLTVEVPDLKPGRYSIPGGWLDVS